MSSEIVVNYIEHLKNNKQEHIHIFYDMVDNDKKLIQELEESIFIAKVCLKYYIMMMTNF